jgi:hypothetical protein
MLQPNLLRKCAGILFLTTCLLGFAHSSARADILFFGCNCMPSCSVFQSDFFGYYRTCWRPWPGGQPECPVYVPPLPEAAAKGAATLEPLPTPMPAGPEGVTPAKPK